jgi:phosphoglycolate phosphatase
MATRFNPILFDLDATLIDSGKDIANSVNHTLQELDLPSLEEDQIISFVGDGVRTLMQRTLSIYNLNNVDRAVQLFKKDYFDNCLVNTRPYPGVEDLLRQLGDARLGVVTNKPFKFARMILDGLELSGYFQTVVGGDETERLKPYPDPLMLACKRLKIGFGHGVMIGDHPNDIIAGQQAGMKTCGVLWGFDKGAAIVEQASFNYLANSVSQLGRILVES